MQIEKRDDERRDIAYIHIYRKQVPSLLFPSSQKEVPPAYTPDNRLSPAHEYVISVLVAEARTPAFGRWP